MNNFGCGLAFFAILAVIFSYTDANAIDRELVPVMEMDESDYVMDLLGKLERAVVRQNHYQDLLRHPSMKRGLDLGLNRGFSGSQAAKHLMGLAAANFAGGPGRRRRSIGSGAAP